MGNSEHSRNLAVATAERLFRQQGYSATGLAQIIAESGSPKGSFYYLFPDGKAELALQVLDRYCAAGASFLKHAGKDQPDDAGHYIRAVCAGLGAEMAQSGFQLGCAMANIAMDKALEDPALAARLQAGFTQWQEALASQLSARGLSVREADKLASALLAALEGARTLARVQGSASPFEAVADLFANMVDARHQSGHSV